jgi:hypothetical protein
LPNGTLSVTYELAIANFVVQDPGPFIQQIAGHPPWTATLRPSDAGLELLIEFATDDPSSGLAAADAQAHSIADHLTFRLCDHGVIQRVAPRRLGSPRFQSSEPNTLHAFVGEVVLAGEAFTCQVTHRVPGKSVAGALADFALHQVALTQPVANDIVIARQMYLAGLSVQNPIASFLIVYTAAAVFANFKSRTGRLQERIDATLKAEDPAIAILTPPPSSKKRAAETEFTAARNNFIHAEERGRDPTAAMAELESLTPRFQILMGRILRKG